MSRQRLRQLVRHFKENGIKLMLEDPDNLREMLGLADSELFDHIDFGRMEIVRTTFVQRDYRHVEADLVVRVPQRLPGKLVRYLTLYILIEHQSEPDEWTILRVIDYVTQIYKWQLRERKRELGRKVLLAPVLPVVFYTGARLWPVLPSLANRIERGERFGKAIPALEPVFLNLSVLPATKLERQGGLFGWVLRLLQERRARPDEFADLLRRVVAQVDRLSSLEKERWLDLLSYVHALVYHEREGAEIKGLQETIAVSVASERSQKEVRTMGRTMAEVLRARGRKEGIEKGIVRGKQETLLRQLRQRFEAVPAATVATIKSATDTAQLDAWLDQVLTADTLEEVGVPQG